MNVVISPKSMARFGRDNADLPPAAVVRQVLDALAFDEHRLFQYRFDHKLAHYLIMREFTRLPVPRSAGLASLASNVQNSHELAKRLEAEFPSGYVIKSSLGAGSGDDGSFDVTANVLATFPNLPQSADHLDPHLVQERLTIDREYRVHTCEDRIVEDLILPRHDEDPTDAHTRARLAAFTRQCLDSMPDALVHDAVCGWDIADTGDGLIVVEINYTGFHPQWQRGFQTSGFLQEPPLGVQHLATWLRWIGGAYGLHVSVASTDAGWDDPVWAQELARFARG